MTHRLLTLAGAPIIALPAHDRLARRIAVSQIHGFTPKRRLLKFALGLATATGTDRVFTTNEREIIKWSSGLAPQFLNAQLSLALNCEVSAYAVMWPWPSGAARGRIYLQTFDRTSSPIAFVKLSTRADQNTFIRREAALVRRINTHGCGYFSVPQLLCSGTLEGLAYVAFKPLPRKLSQVSPRELTAVWEQARSTLACRQQPFSTVTSTHWWNVFRDGREHYSAAFEVLENELSPSALNTCAVHGDFMAQNVIRGSDQLWLVDWERGSLTGPRWTDRASLFLDVHRKLIAANPFEAAKCLQDELMQTGAALQDVIAALAYLSAVGSADATRLLGNWRPTRSRP